MPEIVWSQTLEGEQPDWILGDDPQDLWQNVALEPFALQPVGRKSLVICGFVLKTALNGSEKAQLMRSCCLQVRQSLLGVLGVADCDGKCYCVLDEIDHGEVIRIPWLRTVIIDLWRTAFAPSLSISQRNAGRHRR